MVNGNLKYGKSITPQHSNFVRVEGLKQIKQFFRKV